MGKQEAAHRGEPAKPAGNGEPFAVGQRRILESISTGGALSEVLDQIVKLIEAQDEGLVCSILLLDPDRQCLRHGAAPHLPIEFVRSLDCFPIGPNEASCGAAAYRRKPIIIEDIAVHPNWRAYRELALRYGVRACWSSPIFSPTREVLGTFALYRAYPHVPGRREIDWVNAATHLASIAILSDRNERAIRRGADELKRSQAEFKSAIESEEKLRAAAYEHISDLVCYLGVEEGGRLRVLSANPAAFRITGLKESQTVGRLLEEVLPREAYERHFENYRRAVRERRTIKWDAEFSSPWPSGLRFAEVVATPVCDATGRCTNLVVTAHDITERRKAQEQIEAQAALLDRAHEAILLRGFDGVVHFWNEGAARIFGYPRTEAIGRNVKDLVYRDLDDFERAQAKLATDGVWSGEICQYTRDGKKRFIEASWTLLRDRQGNPKYVLAINSDITEKKNLQTQIILAQRMESLGTLAGGIAHDFNNILTAVLGNVGLLIKSPDLDPKARQKLRIVQAAGQRAADLVGQILAFSRHRDTKRALVSLDACVEEATQLLRASLPPLIEVCFDRVAGGFPIEADPSQIHQIVMNLGTNAAHAIGDRSGTIRITLEPVELRDRLSGAGTEAQPGRYMRIRISDTGSGMDEALLRRVFDPFFTTKPVGKGTGLGLSVVHGIVKGHHGAITVASQLGHGTVFDVYLPEPTGTRIEAAPAGHEPAEPPPPARARAKPVLYVDDEESIVALVTERLQSLGFRVSGFTDPHRAVEAFSARPDAFTAVITDVSMTGMSGRELARAIFAINPGVPIVMVSGYLDAVEGEHLNCLGVRALLFKPAFIDELAPTLNRILSEAAAA